MEYDEMEQPQRAALRELLSEISVDQDSDRSFAEILYTASETGMIEDIRTEEAGISNYSAIRTEQVYFYNRIERN